jgi:hypothetical protein
MVFQLVFFFFFNHKRKGEETKHFNLNFTFSGQDALHVANAADSSRRQYV